MAEEGKVYENLETLVHPFLQIPTKTNSWIEPNQLRAPTWPHGMSSSAQGLERHWFSDLRIGLGYHAHLGPYRKRPLRAHWELL